MAQENSSGQLNKISLMVNNKKKIFKCIILDIIIFRSKSNTSELRIFKFFVVKLFRVDTTRSRKTRM